MYPYAKFRALFSHITIKAKKSNFANLPTTCRVCATECSVELDGGCTYTRDVFGLVSSITVLLHSGRVFIQFLLLLILSHQSQNRVLSICCLTNRSMIYLCNLSPHQFTIIFISDNSISLVLLACLSILLNRCVLYVWLFFLLVFAFLFHYAPSSYCF